MNDISELERRVLYALERIGNGINSLANGAGRIAPQADPHSEAAPVADRSEVEDLQVALEVERNANAQLTERVRAIKEKQENTVTVLERKVARLTEQLDSAGSELQRHRRMCSDLIETNQTLSDAARDGMATPDLIDQAMATEIAAMRAARAAEMAEMEEIMAELKPLIGEVA